MHNKKKKTPFFRSVKGFALIALLLVVALAAIFLFFKVEPIAEDRLREAINLELAPNAEIEFAEFSFSLFPAGVAIRDIRLVHRVPFEDHTPQKSADAIRRFEIETLELSGLDLFRMLINREWYLEQLLVKGLKFELVPLTEGRLADTTPFRELPQFLIGKIVVEKSSFTSFLERDADVPEYDVRNIYAEIENVSVTDVNDPFHTYFDEFYFQSSFFSYNTPDGNYFISVDSLSVSSRDYFVRAEGGRIDPLLSAYEMAQKEGTATDRFDVSFEKFSAENVPLKNWFEKNEFIAESIRFDKPSLIIKRDKSFPRAERRERSLPATLLKNLPFDVQIDSLIWNNGYVSYTEDFSDENRQGNISFHDASITVHNIQNQSFDDSISVRVNTRFLDLADLNLEASFSMADDSHTIQGSLSGFDLSLLNPSIEEWIFIRVRRGNAEHLDFYFRADESGADGVMQFIYTDLNIRFLDEENLQETRSRRLRSFIANQFRIRSNNSADTPRTGTIEFERDNERTIFSYWWQSLSSGLVDSIKR